MTKTLAILSALLLVGLVAGCSSGSPAVKPTLTATATTVAAVATSAAPVAATTAKPTPRAKPKPVVWTKAKAGREYLAMVGPSNKLIDHCNTYAVEHSVSQYRSTAGKLAKADDVLARALLAGKWPANAKAPVAAFYSKLLVERIQWKSVADSHSFTEINAVKFSPDASAAATAVRIALGLPSN